MAKDERDQLLAMLSRFELGVLITVATDGELRGRPVTIASVERDGELVLCTRLEDAEVQDIENDPRCAVVVQGKTRWASLTGRAEIEHERARVERQWREHWRLWLPEGKEDPDIRLVRVRPNEAAYWDEAGVRNVRFAPKPAPARPEPMTPPAHPEQHGKAEL